MRFEFASGPLRVPSPVYPHMYIHMMSSRRNINIRKLIASVFLTALLSGCAESNSPVSQDLIWPEQDETGFMQDLVDSNGDRPMTLLDSVIQQGVPAIVATTAFSKFDQFRAAIKREEFIVMIDFTQHSNRKRMYVVNRISGLVESLHTAHGEGSDPDNDGMAQYFSNIPNSRMSSLGSYIINERYVGKWGPSLRMDGLESTNSNVRKRTIVMHPASYVGEGQPKQGLSWGCPAVPFAWIDRMISGLRDGGFMYAYGINQYKETVADEMWQVLSLGPKFHWTDESDPH